MEETGGIVLSHRAAESVTEALVIIIIAILLWSQKQQQSSKTLQRYDVVEAKPTRRKNTCTSNV